MNTTTRTPEHATPTLADLRAAAHELHLDEATLASFARKAAPQDAAHAFRGLAEEPGLKTLDAPAAPELLMRGPKHLNVDTFGKALHAALKDSVVGYVMGMRQNGAPIYGLQWNWAHMPQDGGAGWTGDTVMHMASVSKLITGIAMVRLLGEKGISYDAKIAPYLPGYWAKGTNIDKITFRQLLTHRSGFVAGSLTAFGDIKAKVAQGVSSAVLGTYNYENMNFGLCRVLLAVINGNIAKASLIGDVGWDIITLSAYAGYCEGKVFAPAGASGSLSHSASHALAYSFPPVGNGWDSGNLGGLCGGTGWHMSANDLLKVMDAFRRKGSIVSAATAQTAMDSSFGLDVVQNTPAGRLYNKNGRWTDGANRTEQALAYFLPENMELVVYANSMVGLPAKFFRSVVSDLYLAHLA